jgi:hypothetical protein
MERGISTSTPSEPSNGVSNRHTHDKHSTDEAIEKQE